MTQSLNPSSPALAIHSEKRSFSGFPMSSAKQSNGSNHFPQKIRNFFRINSLGTNNPANNDSTATPKAETKSSFRQSRFLPSITRNRSTTVASEGNPLDDGVSPTAHANPYFAHQGPPALRHHNNDSVPPSPPDTPVMKAEVVGGANDQAIAAGKEELARKLRRVASAPNAQGLFGTTKSERPATVELGKESFVQHGNSSTLGLAEQPKGDLLTIPTGTPVTSAGQLRQSIAFRRTYSSNSIKVRNVEVGPGSFDKIKLIGKGDVGKVYLVREKKSSRLYAMKGKRDRGLKLCVSANIV